MSWSWAGGHAGCEAAAAAARAGRGNTAAHRVACDRRRHVVQSGHRRVGQGPPRPRDRRARRPHGARHRQGRHPVPECSIAARAPPSAVHARRRDRKLYAAAIQTLLAEQETLTVAEGMAARLVVEHGRVAGLATEGRQAHRLWGGGTDDRHVPERSHPYRQAYRTRRPRRRGAVPLPWRGIWRGSVCRSAG